jgi:predicted nucleic acid-binding protein
MKQAGIVDLTEGIALSAAGLGLKYSLPLADSVVYASATASGAQLITGDMHFRGLPGVKLLENV